MGAGGGIYAVLWGLYFAVRTISAYDTITPPLGSSVVIHNIDVYNIYGGLRNNWAGQQSGQLAIQYNDSRHINAGCFCVGNNVAV